MPTIDLAQFGVPISIEGVLQANRKAGQRFLFLFNETHTDYPAIRQNLLNACALFDEGAVSCVGVEGVYDFDDWSAAEIDAESKKLFDDHEDDLGVLDFLVEDAKSMDEEEPGRPHLSFGTCLKLLRPELPIKCVESNDLADAASGVQLEIMEKHANLNEISLDEFTAWVMNGTHEEATDMAMQEFRNHEINKSRDQAFLSNMLQFWEANGTDKAAILNAGTAHLDRLAKQLPIDIKFAQIQQTDSH